MSYFFLHPCLDTYLHYIVGSDSQENNYISQPVIVQTTFKRPGAKTRRRACGGALISARFILTARHCVSWDHSGQVVDGRRVAVWLGSHGREGQDGVSLPVKRIIIRPDYQQPQCARSVKHGRYEISDEDTK